MQCCDFDRSLTEFAGNCKHENSFGFQAGAEHIKMLDPLVARSFVMALSENSTVMCVQSCAGSLSRCMQVLGCEQLCFECSELSSVQICSSAAAAGRINISS